MPTRYLACIAFICLMAITGKSQNKVVVIGSSTACGYGLSNPSEESWVNRTKDYYLDKKIITSSANVLNLAVVGTNCITGMPTGYVSTYSNADFHQSDSTKNISAAIISAPKPNVVIVSYPTNGYDWMPFDEIMSDLRRIKQYSDSAGIRCFITTTQPRNTFTDAERAKLKELRDSIMAAFGYFAIDFWTPLALPDNSQNPLYALDNVHPNAAGHELLFNNVIAKDIFGPTNAPLPVLDFNLSIRANENQIQLTWRSTSNDPAVYFNVEKSKDGRLFYNIATIKNNGSMLSYADKNITDGNKVFYRIAEIDMMGHVQYSKIIKTEIVNKRLYLTGLVTQTNKTNFSFYVSTSRNLQTKISLVNSVGQSIRQLSMQLNSGNNKIDLLLPTSNGIYYLNISNDEANLTRKIMKL